MSQQPMDQDAIQGRLNQREVPWKATVDPNGRDVNFKPKDGALVWVGWDQTQPPSLDQIVDWLGSYRG